MTSTPVVVTGAAGFVGFHVCRALLADGRPVIGVDRGRPDGDPAALRRRNERLALLLREPNFTAWSLDLADLATRDRLASLTASPVIHLAAQPGVRVQDRPRSARDNLLATTHVLDAAAAAGAPHVVYASSSSVYGDVATEALAEDTIGRPLSFYAATKRAGEVLATAVHLETGLPVTGVRLFNVYGPWGRPDMVPELFARRILDDEPLTVFGDPWRDLTWVGDVAAAILALLERPAGERVLNIGAGAPVRIRDVITGLERRLGRAARIVDLPARAEERVDTRADTRRLQAAIGAVPRTGIEAGLDAFCAWFADPART